MDTGFGHLVGISEVRLGTFGHFMRDTHGHARVMTCAREPLRLDGFRRKCVERVTGIEPAWPAWKAGALPLSYTRVPRGADSV